MQEKKSVLAETNIFIDHNLTFQKRQFKAHLISLAKDLRKNGANKVIVKQKGLIVDGVFKIWDANSKSLVSPPPSSPPVVLSDSAEASANITHSKND